jgi:hypothetical protein
LIWFCCWMVALWNSPEGAAEATDWMQPPTWTGNYWGPAATRARATGQLPPLPTNAAMARWRGWGQTVLRDGDIVFRLGDARTLRGILPLRGYPGIHEHRNILLYQEVRRIHSRRSMHPCVSPTPPT